MMQREGAEKFGAAKIVAVYKRQRSEVRKSSPTSLVENGKWNLQRQLIPELLDEKAVRFSLL